MSPFACQHFHQRRFIAIARVSFKLPLRTRLSAGIPIYSCNKFGCIFEYPLF